MANNGFFDSVNGDRVYSASDFGRMFEGIISDGVIRSGLACSSMMGGAIGVTYGRAYFNGTWFTNDSPTTVTATMSPSAGKHQMAAIVICVDFSNRITGLKVIFGDPNLTDDSTSGMCTDMATRLQGSTSRYSGVHNYVLATVICYNGNYTVTDHRGANCPSGYSAIASYLANWATGITNDGSLPSAFDYGSATSKPQINGIELVGNKTGQELGITGSTFITSFPTITQSGSDVILNYSGVTGLSSGYPKKIILSGWASVCNFQATFIKSASNNNYGLFSVTANPSTNHPFSASLAGASTYSLSGTNLTFTMNGISGWGSVYSISSMELVW